MATRVKAARWAVCGATAVGVAAAARAAVPVEQIESFEYDAGDNITNLTRYAAIDFNGSSGTVTVQPGQYGGLFDNVTFHAAEPNSTTTPTLSNHAYYAGNLFYGVSSPAYGSVTDVYADGSTGFLANDVKPQGAPAAAGPVPAGFDGGSLVIANDWIGSSGTSNTSTGGLDLLRRVDFMVNRADATFVAAAVSGLANSGRYYDQVWSAFDSLAVSGAQSFDPTNPVNAGGKQHADLTVPNGDASFAVAGTAGSAAALIAAGQAAGQADVAHGVVVRSLFMAGADKVYSGSPAYARQTANNLDVVRGAGVPDLAASRSILNGGEKPLLAYPAAGGAVGTPATTSRGWTEGTIPAGGQSVVLISAAQALTGVTASLNWDVTQKQTGTTLDTTDAGVTFPNLTLELRPVTMTGGQYVLGPSLNDPTLRSAATGDNVQYLYSTGTLPAGTYALVVTGDPTYAPTVGLSYLLRGSFATSWNNSSGSSWGTPANWTDGVPDAQAAVANFGSNPGLTGPAAVTLDANRTVGRLTFANANSYTIAAGTGGTLTIDDTGASAGVPAPSISVTLGSHAIAAPVTLAAGVAVDVSAGSALTLAGDVTGAGGLSKAGGGTLTLGGTNAYGSTNVSAGSLVLTRAATLGGDLTVTGGTATFAGGAGTAVLVRQATNLTVTGGTVALAPSTPLSSLVATSLTFGGSTAVPVGQLDLGNGDLIVRSGDLSAVTAAATAGYAGGQFTGPGLTSSVAAADAGRVTAVGVIGNANAAGGAIRATFDGQPVAAGDVLAKYTYFGDANLDGVVNGVDYGRIDAGYNAAGTLTGWFNGDFNYDGKVDGSDYTLIDNAFNLQGPTLAAAAVPVAATAAEVAAGAVPEPTAAGLLATAVGTAALAGRRRLRSVTARHAGDRRLGR